MTTIELFTSHWHWNITALVITSVLIIFHLIANEFKLKKNSPLFFSGIILFLIVTLSPLDFLAHNYLFSAHMIEHIILLLIVPPLLLSGTSSKFLERLNNKPWFNKIGNILFHPLVAWILGIGSMGILHVPSIFKSISHFPFLHEVQMILLLIFGTIFIWPVFTPIELRKLQPLQSVVYLFTACLGCTILGILITFAPAGLYLTNLNNANPIILNLIKSKWGITQAIDQQAGGLIMWVPACAVYITNIMIILNKWFRESKVENYNGTAIPKALDINKT